MILRIFCIIVYLFVSHDIYAQKFVPRCFTRIISNTTTIDSGNIQVLYALNAVDIKNIDTYDDLHRLEIGGRRSKYYSYFIYKADSLRTDCEQKEAGKPPRIYGSSVAPPCPIEFPFQGKDQMWSEYYYSEYYKDFSTNVFNEYVRMPLGIPKYQYSENIAKQNWSLHDDTLTIVGYLCQKATCRFRGRNYIAWFTTDIPIDNGPWKFGGLPGLILKVYDENKLYVFECVVIENHETKYPIEMLEYKDYTTMKREKLLKLQRSVNENYINTVSGTLTVRVVSGKDLDNLGPEVKHKKVLYQPLELE
jgi:GLPGLI family protein